LKRYLTLVVAVCAMTPAAASAQWAPADSATIHPGVEMLTEGAQCTANFVYTDGGSTYLGYAAHCAGLGAATDTNGCTAPSHPVGTPVEIEGASRPGTLAYSSWVTMQAAGEDPASEACAYNDFALVRIDPADVGSVNPSVPGWGGPTGTASLGGTGSDTYTYGNSSLRFGVTFLKPKQGKVVSRSPEGWSTTVYTATPGIPGDSGSGFLNATGAAAGTLSTVAIAPLAGSNGVGDLPNELAYMRSHGGPQASVVNGTEPFQTDLLTAILNAK
jgi:hypothetical protein